MAGAGSARTPSGWFDSKPLTKSALGAVGLTSTEARDFFTAWDKAGSLKEKMTLESSPTGKKIMSHYESLAKAEEAAMARAAAR